MLTANLDAFEGFQTDLLPPYQIPDGYYDRFCAQVWNPPFSAYTANAGFGAGSVLTPAGFPPSPYFEAATIPAVNLLAQGLYIGGDYDFILRAIGLPEQMGGSFQLYTPGLNKVFGLPIPVRGPNQNNNEVIPVIPEIVYPSGSQITFDLLGIDLSVFGAPGLIGLDNPANNIHSTGADNPVRIFTEQLVFYGVKRFRGNLRNPAISAYEYRERPYTYRAPFNLNFSQFTATAAPVIRYSDSPTILRVPITNYDFELRRIRVATVGTAGFVFATPAAGTWGGLNSGAFDTFRMQMYDAANNRLTEGASVNNSGPYTADGNGMQPKFWSYEMAYPFGSNAVVNNNTTLPCPPVMYPKDSEIRIDIRSMLAPQVLPATNNIVILLEGVQRIPN